MKELQTTLLYVIKEGKILLATKKRGFGEGKFNGMGGKVEKGESIEEAMIRETREEINILPLDYEKMATFTFDEFVKGERELVTMHVFVAKDYNGKEIETEEMRPEWFNLDAIPYGNMFSDDKIWLPQILNGKKLEGHFVYDEKFNILSYDINEI